MIRRFWTPPMVLALGVLALCAAALVTLTTTAAHAGHARGHRAADTVFFNGKVLLYEKHDRWASAVAVDDGVITYVGKNRHARKLIGPDTRVVNLHGKTLMPGIIDGHVHGRRHPDPCEFFGNGYVRGSTVEIVLGQLKRCLLDVDQVDLLHGETLLITGRLDIGPRWGVDMRLTRHDLDRLSAAPEDDEFGTGTTRPILIRNGAHDFSTNSQALINAGIDENTPDPASGQIIRDANGVPTGEFTGFSGTFSQGVPTAEFVGFSPDWGPPAPVRLNARYQAFVEDIADANRTGVTSLMRPGHTALDLPAFKRVADDGLLNVRVSQGIIGTDLRGENDRDVIRRFVAGLNEARRTYDGYKSPASPGEIRVDTVKIFCDGLEVYPFQTGALLRPYNINVGTPEDPVWVPGTNRGEDPSCDDATRGFVALDRNRWSIYTHSIGDRATRTVLDNLEVARRVNGRWDSRHVITHLSFVDPADRPRFGELGVVASFTAAWAGRAGGTVDRTDGYIDPSVTAGWMPMRSLQQAGAVLSGSTDNVHLPIWRHIETAITRESDFPPDSPIPSYPGKLVASEALSRLDSLKMHTKGGAYQMHLNTGEIKKGKLADLIVIDRNPMTIPEKDISNTKVLMTMLGGKVVWDDPDTDL